MSALRRHYGSTPLHLLLHLALLAAFAWVALQANEARDTTSMVIWFLGALLLHDLVLLPFYSVLDRVARRGAHRRSTNYIRVPVVLSGLLLLLFFPPMLGCNEGSFESVAGVAPEGYLQRWLLLSAALFALAAVLYVVRGRRSTLAANAS